MSVAKQMQGSECGFLILYIYVLEDPRKLGVDGFGVHRLEFGA